MSRALLDALRAYKPGSNGVHKLSDRMHIVLPIDDWCAFSWMDQSASSLTAGQTDAEVMFTVPNDERIWLESVSSRIVSGDNTLTGIRLVVPVGYGGGDRNAEIILITAAVQVYWPDAGSGQVVQYVTNKAPLLLEPGTTIAVVPSGAGAAISTTSNYIWMRRIKMVRALAPFPA